MKVGEAKDGERATNVVLGETKLHFETWVLYVEDTAVSILLTRAFPGPTPLYCACSHVSTPAQPFNIVTTLLAIFLPCLTYSRPQPCRPLTQLSSHRPLNHPPLQMPPFSPVSLASICLSLFNSLPSPPPIMSLGFLRNRSPDEGEDIAASALILWKLISRTELQIPPPGTLAFERQGSVENLGPLHLNRWSWLV